MRTYLTTVGISLLLNARRHFDLGRDEMPSEPDVANYLRHGDPVQVSAETNALHRVLDEGDRIVFLHSATDEGSWCAEALRRHFSNTGYPSEQHEIADLSYRESGFKLRGLRALVTVLVTHIHEERAQGREVVINATGGFKAEIAFATLVGLLLSVPVLYIHERFGEIVEMPPAPVDWDYTLLADHEDLLDWLLAEDRATETVQARLRERPEKLRLLLAEEDGMTRLSPAGLALFEAYLDRTDEAEGVSVLLSSRARATYEGTPVDRRHVLDRALKRLRMRGLRLKHSESLSGGRGYIYPRGPRDERVFYTEGDDGSIYVCELFASRYGKDMKDYKALWQRGVCREDYQGFTLWPPDSES